MFKKHFSKVKIISKLVKKNCENISELRCVKFIETAGRGQSGAVSRVGSGEEGGAVSSVQCSTVTVQSGDCRLETTHSQLSQLSVSQYLTSLTTSQHTDSTAWPALACPPWRSQWIFSFYQATSQFLLGSFHWKVFNVWNS